MYLVSEVNYEYNDEVYYTHNDDAVLPVRLYNSKEKAEEVAVKKTVTKIKEWNENLSAFGYSIDEVFDTDALNVLAVANGFEKVEDDGYGEEYCKVFVDLLRKNDPGLTTNLIEDVLQIKFFKVQEVSIGD